MKRLIIENFPGWNVKINLPFPNLTVNNFSKEAIISSAFFLFLLIFFSSPVSAATYNVNTLADNEYNTCAIGNCTLREAISAANLLPGDDTINLTGLSGTITLAGGNLLVSDSVTINGPGARNLSVSGGNLSRVFLISGVGVTATINRISVVDGNAQVVLIGGISIGDGGGILNTNGATLNLNEVHVSNNTATTLGGGIATRAILGVKTTTNILCSLVDGNNAAAGGGGISNLGTTILSSAVTTISNTTVSNNTALAEGGGVSNTGGTMNLTNNTISYNQATVAGGGIVNVVGVLVGIVNFRNTILAKNNALVGTNLVSSDGLGIFNSLGHNLIGNNLDISASFSASFSAGVLQPNVNGDFVGSIEIGYNTLDPMLGPLQNNGGVTNTRALMTGSPALDSADNCVYAGNCGTDPNGNNPPYALAVGQRGDGFSRLVNGTVDMGAFEQQLAPTSASIAVSGSVLAGKGYAVSGATVLFVDSNGVVRQTRTNSFGLYAFKEVEVGETYIISVYHKRYRFAPRAVTIVEDQSQVNFANY